MYFTTFIVQNVNNAMYFYIYLKFIYSMGILSKWNSNCINKFIYLLFIMQPVCFIFPYNYVADQLLHHERTIPVSVGPFGYVVIYQNIK